jgi:organic radical activating enzyme
VAEQDGFHKQILEMKDKLNAVSPSFCLAKWTWLTLHLPKGAGHSCHLPNLRKIPLAEIQKDPAALHNPEYKKQFRKQMTEGVRPDECSYCWYNEDNAPKSFSERWVHSASTYSAPYFAEIVNTPWNTNVYPRMLEVIFRTACQFACSYCQPEYSTKWADEIKKFGKYQDDYRGLPTDGFFGAKAENPYVDAFWKWWPEAAKRLTTFRISGGEPLIAPETYKVLDDLIEGEAKNFEFIINSNFCVPSATWTRFISKITQILSEGKIPKFILWGSIDSSGAQAEYIRNGLDYELLQARTREFLNATKNFNTGVSFTVTHNNLSLPGFDSLLLWIDELKNEFGRSRVTFYTHRVKSVEHQYLDILPSHFAGYIDKSVKLMETLSFETWEVDLVRRLSARFGAGLNAQEVVRAKKKFYSFFTEHDRRRGTNFLKTFPEYEEFYYHCRDLIV